MMKSLNLILHAVGRHLKGFKQGSNRIKLCFRNKKWKLDGKVNEVGSRKISI